MIKHSNLQGKTIFRSNYFVSQPLLLSCYFNNIFVDLSVTAAVSFFNFKQISYFLSASIIDSEQVNVCRGAFLCVNIITQSLDMSRCFI